MPPRDYWGIKGLWSYKAEASKVRGVRGPSIGRGHKGHKASEFRESKLEASEFTSSNASGVKGDESTALISNLLL